MDFFILEDHPMVLCGLQSIINKHFPDSSIQHHECLIGAIEGLQERSYDLAIIDLNVKGDSGLDFVVKAKCLQKQMKHLIFTSSAQPADFKRAMSLDVDGYLLKECMPEDLVYAIQTIRRGRKYMDPVFMDQSGRLEPEGLRDLTDREREILHYVGLGKNNQEIAEDLFISMHTVKKHISHIFDKLSLKDRSQAIVFSRDHRI